MKFIHRQTLKCSLCSINDLWVFLGIFFFSLIFSKARYDIDHALVLAQIHHFKAGILYLYEKAKLWVQIEEIFKFRLIWNTPQAVFMPESFPSSHSLSFITFIFNLDRYQQILHYHMEQNEYSHVIDTCKKYG